MATVVAGKAQIGFFSPSAVLSAAAGGANLAIVGTGVDIVPFKLFVPAEIKTAADLKGKKVDLGTIGSAIDIDTKIALDKLGLQPSDVVFVTTGSPQTSMQALLAGSIQGRLLNPPQSTELEEKGFHALIDMAPLKIPSATAVYVLDRGYLEQHRDVVQSFVDSIVEGIARTRADKPLTIQAMKKHFKSDNDRAMNEAYDFWVGEVIPALPFPKPDQFTVAKNALASTAPAVASLDVTKLIDPSYVQSAADRGLDKR